MGIFTTQQLDLIDAAVSVWEDGITEALMQAGQDPTLVQPEDMLKALGGFDDQKANCQEIRRIVDTLRFSSE